MALTITVNGAGTFTASMEEGPVSFSASLGAIGPAGPGVAAGGTTGQILVKTTNADYATGWIDNAARSVFITGRNNTGSTIAKGAVVYLSGATGNKATIALALANSESTSARTIGITKAEIANNADGDVVISGAIENIDTSAFSAGQVVYLSATTAGGLQTTLPTQPNHGVVIGIVTRQNANNGSIEVTVQNYQELEELSDVLIASKANNDLLAWDSASSVWKNKTFSTLGLLTSSAAAATYQTIAGMSDYLSKAGNLSGLADAATARTNLGLGSSDTVSFAEVRLPSPDNHAKLTHEFWRPFSAAHGDLGIEYRGDKIKFQDATEQATKGLLPSNNLSDLASASTARTNLGLGTMATETASDYLTKAGNLSGLASNATARTNLDVYSKSESDALVPAASTTVAGKVELATDAEAVAGTSSTLAVTPKGVDEAFLFSGRFLYTTAFSAATSGTGATTSQAGQDAKFVGAPTSAVGYALLRSAGKLVQRGRAYNNGIDFSKRIVLAFRMALRTASTDADSVYRVTLGKDITDNAGDLGLRGFGIKGISGSPVVLTVHDGTTLTDVNSTFTPSGVNSFDVELVSDGSGNVTLFIDGSQVATTTAGPSAAGGTVDYQLQAEAENLDVLVGTRMGFEIANLRVTYSL